jgi:hypothetical protein
MRTRTRRRRRREATTNSAFAPIYVDRIRLPYANEPYANEPFDVAQTSGNVLVIDEDATEDEAGLCPLTYGVCEILLRGMPVSICPHDSIHPNS